MQHAVESAQTRFDAFRHVGVIIGRGAFQIERIKQRLTALTHDGVVNAVELRHFAPKQNHGRARIGARQCGGLPQTAMRADDENGSPSEYAISPQWRRIGRHR